METCIEPFVMEGMNASILTYGQSNSGKTYTMFGNDANAEGLIWNSLKGIFDLVDNTESPQRTAKLSISVVEVYNESVRDLLEKKSCRDTSRYDISSQWREEAPRRRPVEGRETLLTQYSFAYVQALEDAAGVIKKALSHRIVSETGYNSTSSRSHCIITVRLEQYVSDSHGNALVASNMMFVVCV